MIIIVAIIVAEIVVVAILWAAARMAGIVEAEQAALHSPATGEGE